MFPDVNRLKHTMEKKNNRWQKKCRTHKKGRIKAKQKTVTNTVDINPIISNHSK